MPLNEDRQNGNYKLFYNKQSFKTLSCVAGTKLFVHVYSNTENTASVQFQSLVTDTNRW